MQRAEQAGLGLSVAGHVAIFTILSLGLFAAAKPPVPVTQPIDIQIVDKVGLTDTAPEPPKVAPAQSVAPEVGIPEDATPGLAPPAPAPVPVQREAVPPPKPAPVAKPTPPKPAPPRPALARPTVATPPKPAVAPARGSKLGDDFRKGLTATPSNSTSQAPRVATVGPAQLAGLAAAIRRQVQPCADRITSPGPGAERITTKINLRMNRDGSFAANPSVVGQVTDDDNARYGGRVGELAKAAFVQCAPFDLPADLYDGWKNINLNYKLPG